MQMATAIESDNGDMIVKRVSVPLGLEELMEGLTKEVLQKKPRDIYIFASEYFANLLQMREKTAFKGIPIRKSHSVVKQIKPENLSRNNRSKTVDSSNKKYFGRQKSIREQSPDIISSIKKVPLNVSKIDKSKSIINKHNKARKELGKTNEKDVSSSNVSSSKSTPRVTRDTSIKRDRSKDGKTVSTPRQKSQESREQKIKINGRKIVSKSADKVVLSSVVKRPEVAAIAPSAIIKDKNKDEGVLSTAVKETQNKSNQGEDISKESDEVIGCKMTTNDAVDLTQKQQNNSTENLGKKVDENIADIANNENVKEEGNIEHIAKLADNNESAEKSSKSEENKKIADEAVNIDKENVQNEKIDNKKENVSTEEGRKSSEVENEKESKSDNISNNDSNKNLKQIDKEDDKLKEQEEEKSENNSTKSASEKTTNAETTLEDNEDSSHKEPIAQENVKEVENHINVEESKKLEVKDESALDKPLKETEKIEKNNQMNADESKNLEEKEKLPEEAEKSEKSTNEMNQSSFDTSKLRNELNEASTVAQSSFKTSFNPFVLRQEINKASESTEIDKNEVSKIVETAKQVAAAIKIQSLWRGFCDRKNAKYNKNLTENKKENEQKQEEIKQISEINTNEHLKMEEAAMQVAAAVKIQSLWRDFLKRKNAKSNLNSDKALSENKIHGKQQEKIVKENNENLHPKMEETAKQIAAAIKIQSLWREFSSRKNKLNSNKIPPEKSEEIRPETQNAENSSEMLKMAKAVLSIQSVWRGFQVRKLKKRGELFGTTIEKELKQKEDLKTHFAENKNNAARKIQSLWRGYQVRKNVDEVNKHLSELQKPAECDELPSQRGNISDDDIFKAASKIQAGYRGYVVRKKRDANLTSISEEPLKDDEILKAIEQLDEIPTEPPTKVHKTEKSVSFITSPNKKLVKTFSMDSINNKSGQIEKLKSNSLETDQNSDSYDGYIINDLSKQHSSVLATEMKRNIENICKNYDNDKSILQDENNANIKTEIENATTVEPAEYKTSPDESISNSLNKPDNVVDSLHLQSEETTYEEAPTRPVTSDIIQDPLHNPNLFSDVKAEDSASNRNNIQMENVGIGLLKDTDLNNDKLYDEDKQVLHEINKKLNYDGDDDDAITVENIKNQKRPLSLESNASHDSVATVIFNDDNSEDKEMLGENEISGIDAEEAKNNAISGESSDFNKSEEDKVLTENESKENGNTESEGKTNKESECSGDNNSVNKDDKKTPITEIEKLSLDKINKTESDNAEDITNPVIQNASYLLEDNNNKSSELLEEQSNDEKVNFKNKDEKIESLNKASDPDSESIENDVSTIEENNLGIQQSHVKDISNLKEEHKEKIDQNEMKNEENPEKHVEIIPEKVEEQQLSKSEEIVLLKHSNDEKDVGDNNGEEKKQELLDKQEEKKDVKTLDNKENKIIDPVKEKNDLEVQHSNVEESSNINENKDNQTNKDADISKCEEKQEEIKSEEKQPLIDNKEIDTLSHSEVEKNGNANKEEDRKIGGSDGEDIKEESLSKHEEKQELDALNNQIESEAIVEPLFVKEKSDEIQHANVENNYNLKEEHEEKPDNTIQNKEEISKVEEKIESKNKKNDTLDDNAKQYDKEIETSQESILIKHADDHNHDTLKDNKEIALNDESIINNKINKVEPLIKENNDLVVKEANGNLKEMKTSDNEKKSGELLNTEEKNINDNLKEIESIDEVDQNTKINNNSVQEAESNDDIILENEDKNNVQNNKKENDENNKSSENEQINNTKNTSSENTETTNNLKNAEIVSNKSIKTSEALDKNPEDIIDKTETENNKEQKTGKEAEEVKINNNTLLEATKMEEKHINIQNNEEENNLVELDAKTVDNNNTLPTEDESNSEIENTSNNGTLNATKIAHKNNDDEDLYESSSDINKTSLDPGTSNNDSNNKTQGNDNKNNSSSTSSNDEDNKITSTTDEAQVIPKNNTENVPTSEQDHEKNKFDISNLQKEIQEHAKLNTQLLNQEIDESDKKFKESVISGVKPDYYKQNNKNDDVELKINENVESMASGNAENNKLNVDKLQSEIFENLNKSEFTKTSSEELLSDNNGDEFYIPIRELSDIKEEEGETKQANDDDPPESQETSKSGGLVHSGELSDSMSLPMVASPPGRASSRDGQCQTEPLAAAPGLVNTGEFHDNVLPLSVQLNEASPAGPAVLTSEMSKSINNGISGQEKAQASSKDASTCETQPDNVSPLPISSMETEKRNNASLPAKKNMEAEAATKIQAGFRGYQVRKQMKSKKTAPGDISNQRRSARRKSSGRLTDSARNSQQKTSKQQPSDLEEKSAVKIQAGVRGFLVRRRQKKQKGDEDDDESS